MFPTSIPVTSTSPLLVYLSIEFIPVSVFNVRLKVAGAIVSIATFPETDVDAGALFEESLQEVPSVITFVESSIFAVGINVAVYIFPVTSKLPPLKVPCSSVKSSASTKLLGTSLKVIVKVAVSPIFSAVLSKATVAVGIASTVKLKAGL